MTPSMAACVEAHVAPCCHHPTRSWGGPTGHPFNLPSPAVCVPYPGIIPTHSSPACQLCGSVPPLWRVQPYIMNDAHLRVFPVVLYLRWVSLSSGIGCLGFSQGCCRCGPLGSKCSCVLLIPVRSNSSPCTTEHFHSASSGLGQV